MSLIEHLDDPGWREFLAGTFATTLDLLDSDPHRWAGSSVDDLRAWLRAGGLALARRRLDDQADRQGFSSERRAEILSVFNALIAQHRATLVRLGVRGVLPASPVTAPPGIEPPLGTSIEDCLAHVAVGERPFDAWMRANGRSEAEIAAVYEVVDAWIAVVLATDPSAN